MKNSDQELTGLVLDGHRDQDPDAEVGVVDLLTWLGEGKWIIAAVSIVAALASLGVAMLWPPTFTARTTFLAPSSPQQNGSAATLAALGSLGTLAGGLAAKTPDELYVALLKSDSVQRSLAERFDLKTRYDVKTYESLRKELSKHIQVSSDRKSGLIVVEVDDDEAKFAAELANAHASEVGKVLGRLAVSEAQLRRIFYEKQLRDSKESLIKAEQDLRVVQEKSGVIVLDKQAEALIAGAAQVRAMVAEREVRLKVLRTGATGQNPDVIRLNSELAALRAELSRMESAQGTSSGSAVDLPVGRIPEAAIDYVRARREVKLQETLLEGLIRQYELARLDEAKEGPALQQVDVALPPDRRSKPSRVLIVGGSVGAAIVLAAAFVLFRRFDQQTPNLRAARTARWRHVARAWGLRN